MKQAGATVKFGIGQPLRRKEDPRLLTGRGRFIADCHETGEAHAWFVRSVHGHGHIRAIKAAAAAAMPGVLAVVTAADVAEALGPMTIAFTPPSRPGAETRLPDAPVLASDKVRFVGDNLAMVVAETAAAARDAAEAVTVEIEPLPAVITPAAALAAGAPQLWPEIPGNLAFDWELGDAVGVEAAFAGAHHRVSMEAVNNRVVIGAMETRGAFARCDAASGRFEITMPSQMPHSLRDELAQMFALPENRFRVLINDVGGGFGVKNSLYPEYPLLLWAARELGRSISWVGEREDAFLTDFQGRGRVTRAELALGEDLDFLALRVDVLADLGAHASGRGTMPPVVNMSALNGVYRTPAICARVRGAFTNTVPTEVYRGAGRPEVLHLVERLVDVAAFDLGVDRIDLRRRNTLRPDELPFATPLGLNYDAGRYEETLDACLARADWAGYEARCAASAERGLLRGFGIANYVERCGHGVSESTELRIERDGSATVLSGSQSNGQGHETAFAQFAGDMLGIDPMRVRVIQGDTDQVREGKGTGGSWSIPLGAACLTFASRDMVNLAMPLAADALEVVASDLEFAGGRFVIAGTDRALDWEGVAEVAAARSVTLMTIGRFTPENHTYPNGCHCCEVEVDPETGLLEIVAYTVAHDFGRTLNPLMLAGQVHGGVVQGLGQAGFEHVVYDETGQFLSGSLLDYCLPRADQLPLIDFLSLETPSPSNPAGFKGCGEAGAAGSPPALANAVMDAFRPLGVRHIDMPYTPQRVWRAIQNARNSQ